MNKEEVKLHYKITDANSDASSLTPTPEISRHPVPARTGVPPMESETRFVRENIYTSCCCKLDKRAAHFFAQLLITLLMLFFCIYYIISGDPAQSGPVWALIGTFVGYWFDSPSISE